MKKNNLDGEKMGNNDMENNNLETEETEEPAQMVIANGEQIDGEELLMEEPVKKKKRKGLWIGLSVVLIFAFLIFVITTFLNTSVFMQVVVVGHSMDNTLADGDIMKANKWKAKSATYGDIIIIKGELEDGLLIKRLIAKGGDSLMFKTDGSVALKKAGEEDYTLLYEPYIREPNSTVCGGWQECQDGNGNIKIDIPENELFFMGDNRRYSSDSRYDGFRTCKTDQIVAVVENWALDMRDFNKFWSNIFPAKETSNEEADE